MSTEVMSTKAMSKYMAKQVSKLCWIIAFAVGATGHGGGGFAARRVRGTWKGDSETIVLGTGNPHHTETQAEPELRSVPFTMVIDKQDGRRFSGTFSSPRSSEKILAVFSRDGTLYMVDDEGYTHGTMLAPDRMELCYMYVSTTSRIASCSEMKKQQ
ncbi:MAG TPA: hypothetical protein VE396_00985 [Xanthobacteraceae bacterium]|jgi:hypothetical protein|nr:hypothetical protein [Xanthobacteraceae bacterium]